MLSSDCPLPTADCPPAPQAPWMQTRAGAVFPLIDPPPEAVDWGDVAAGLARQTRFNGHLDVAFYSIAEHSVRGWRYLRETPEVFGDRLAMIAPEDRALVGRAFLLHDAHEAYLGDWTSPVKWALAEIDHAAAAALARLEHGVAAAIHARAGVPWPLPPRIAGAVRMIDMAMLATERRYLAAPCTRDWGLAAEPLDVPLAVPWTISEAHRQFRAALEAEGIR